MKKITTVSAMIIGLCVCGAIAEESTETGRVSPSTRSDANGDGVISATEWTFGSDQFGQLDTNGDGSLDSSEQAGLRGQRGKGGQGRGKGGVGKGGAGRGKGGAGKGGAGRGRGGAGKGGGGHGGRGAQTSESEEA